MWTGNEMFEASRRNFLRQVAAGSLGFAGASLFADEAHARDLTSRQRQTIVNAAYQLLGIPYANPPSWPRSTDCSLLTQKCYRQAGITIPRTADQQYRSFRTISSQTGAIMFFAANKRSNTAVHCGIRIDNSALWMIHASSGAGKVVMARVTSNTWGGMWYLGSYMP